MSIFNQCDGVGVLRVNDCAPATTATITPAISVDNFSAAGLAVPITGFTLDLGTNHQFLHTLDQFIYLYAFGDRIGELVLSGIAFAGTCAKDMGGNRIEKELAPNNVLSYYAQNSVSRADGPEPTFITIGDAGNVILGFLTGVRLDMPNPTMPIVQWALRYSVVLDKDKVPAIVKRTAAPASPARPSSPARPTGPSGRWPTADRNARPSIPWPDVDWRRWLQDRFDDIDEFEFPPLPPLPPLPPILPIR